MLRVVFDTNLFVSSLLVKEGLSSQALSAWRNRRFVLVTSPAILDEITAALRYDRIRRKYNITDEDVEQLIDLLTSDALIVLGAADTSGSIPEDKDDEAILACAIDGEADLIASGDKQLLALGVFRDIPIATVRQLLDQLDE